MRAASFGRRCLKLLEILRRICTTPDTPTGYSSLGTNLVHKHEANIRLSIRRRFDMEQLAPAAKLIKSPLAAQEQNVFKNAMGEGMTAKQPRKRATAGRLADDQTGSRAMADEPRGDIDKWLSIEEALRVTRAQLQRLAAQHLAIQESERRRVAVELHDGLGQTLSLAKLTMQAAINSVNSGAIDHVRNNLERATAQVKAALEDLRRIAMNLRPSALDDLGIVATMNWYLREVEGAHPNLTIEREISVNEADVPEPLKISIFRIAQEATGNALKHAGADRISVRLTNLRGLLNLAIDDDGRGFDAGREDGHPDFTHGIGLQSMKERAELSGGSYEFQSSPGRGTRIRVWWPPMQASDPQCPVIPMPQAMAQSMCSKSAPSTALPDHFSACLNCIRTLDSNQP